MQDKFLKRWYHICLSGFFLSCGMWGLGGCENQAKYAKTELTPIMATTIEDDTTGISTGIESTGISTEACFCTE